MFVLNKENAKTNSGTFVHGDVSEVAPVSLNTSGYAPLSHHDPSPCSPPPQGGGRGPPGQAPAWGATPAPPGGGGGGRRGSAGVGAKRAKLDPEPTPVPQPLAPPAQPEAPADANMVLKFTYGVNAYKHWAMQKNAALEAGGGAGGGPLGGGGGPLGPNPSSWTCCSARRTS